jgi:multimeric flavodoxin WrbA
MLENKKEKIKKSAFLFDMKYGHHSSSPLPPTSTSASDSFASIKEKVLESHGIVLASPNYIFSVSAQLKAFMDRCCGMVHCMVFEGKYGASVVTSGGGDEEPIAQYMNHFLLSVGVIHMISVWAAMGTILGEDSSEEILRQAHELGKNLVRSWKEKALIPEAEEIKKSFEEGMRRLMLYRKEEWPHMSMSSGKCSGG